jgi:Fe-only nitrogenase accessory protein AnfO
MKIAAFIGMDGNPTDLFDKGELVVFEKTDGEWEKTAGHPLSLNRDWGMAEVKVRLQDAVKPLTPCDVFLLTDLRGVLRVFLEDCGFRIWTSKGPLLSQLDDVANLEVTLAREEASVQRMLPAPTVVGNPEDGVFCINLVELLAAGSCHVSHDLIMPFLETISFARLDVFCDHVPKWFAREFTELDLTIAAKTPDPSGQGMTITVVPRSTARTQPRGRRPGKSSCRCG